MIVRRAARSLMVAMLLAAVVPAGSLRAATIWVWPGPGPCSTTLQACVDHAASGDEVMVEQNGTIDEQISIVNKSLTLHGETGFEPVIDQAVIQKDSGPDAVIVTIADIDFAHSVLITVSAGTGSVITLSHISAVGSGADAGVLGRIYADSTVNVLNSWISQGGFYPAIQLVAPTATGQALKWNVIGNHTSGYGVADAEAGIYLAAINAGSLVANVYNNVIYATADAAPDTTTAGLYLTAYGSGNSAFNVVGNTLDRITNTGISVDNEQSAPNLLSLNLFNNIVAGTGGPAVVFSSHSAGTTAIHAGTNDFYANGQPNQTEGRSLGANLSVKPRFADARIGNLWLTSSSPLIDKGTTCPTGGIAGPDALGENRLAGKSVDIGAYEWNAGKPGLVLVGTNGPDTLISGSRTDILCGYGGDDTLIGTNGYDYLDGGNGNDHLTGGPGHDRLFGGKGNDVLCANDGAGGDYLNGGKGTDSYRADTGDVKVSVEKHTACH